jgi:hypothetical protein
MTPAEIEDEAFPPLTLSASTVVRISMEFREVGPGVDSVEILWENTVPDGGTLAYIVQTLLQAKGEGHDDV